MAASSGWFCSLLLGGAAGWGLGRLFDPGNAPIDVEKSSTDRAEPPASPPESSSLVTDIPTVTLPSGSDFGEIVAQLEADGFDEDFAQWSALVLIARLDFRLAFDVAIERDLVSAWASGAATENPGEAAELIGTLPASQGGLAYSALLRELGRTIPKSASNYFRRCRPDR